MKKVLSLVMVLAITLSLAACGGNNSTTTNQTTTPTETEASTQDAAPLDFESIIAEYKENKISAEDNYFNKNYLLTGGVWEFNDDSVMILCLDSSYFATVKMPREDMKKFSKDDVITVCGKLTSFGDPNDSILQLTLSDAHYVDNITELTGKVDNYHAYDYDLNTIYASIAVPYFKDGKVVECFYDIEIPNCDKTVKQDATVTINDIKLKKGDTVSFSGVMKRNPDAGTRIYTVMELKSIESGN